MKKIVGTIAAMALVASAAFADVGIGAWGRGVWAPVAGNKSGVGTFTAASWGGVTSNIRTGISVHGDSENIGFNIDMNADQYSGGGNVGLGDTAFIWAQPWSWLKVSIGRVQDDTGRGNGCFGGFNWARFIGNFWTGEDITFTRFGNGTGGQADGAVIKITPVDGLWIIACINVEDGLASAEATYKNSQYGAGYQIPSVGHIRAQWNGAVEAIEAAFDLTAVENLFVTVGAQVPVTQKTTVTRVAAYANFKVSMVTIHAMYIAKIPMNNADYSGEVGVGADFDLGNGVAINVDVRNNHNKDNGDLSILAGVAKGFSNGVLGAGFQCGTSFEAGADFTWAIPVKIEYWF